LLRLINDVLEMAKIEANRMQLEIAPFDLGAMVRDVTEMMQIRAQGKGLQLSLDQTSEFPRYIKSDEARIRQILTNLINNAVTFTDRGRITVRVGANRNKQHLLIEVEDSGSGIAPEDQSRIFEPFARLAKDSHRPGTGLGLTISSQFIKLMNGTLSLESIPGQGSLFRVELPVEWVDSTEFIGTKTQNSGDIVGLVVGQPRYRIMIVEDQRENLLLLSRLMSDLGLEVRSAENGKQAIELFQSWQPDLIWMDKQMPVMDGIEATKRIRQLPDGQKVKIVAVTASAFREQQEVLTAAMDDCIHKPYRFDEIYECLARQLGLEYVYVSQPAIEETPTREQIVDMLARLPAALRIELKHELISLNSDGITETIQRITGIDATLARTLSQLAEGFNYPAILQRLDESEHH
jgi:CheY-like chemotaxis protein/anti-sigma regulatory factor (Ser/Thr protein kinase)